MLSMCVKAGYSSQNLHEPISDHYRVPMVSFKDAYFGNSQFQYLYPDSTHPNMVGHPLTALLVTNLLQKCYEDISDITENTNALPKNYVNYEATRYDNPHIADISDIVEGKVSVKIDGAEAEAKTETADGTLCSHVSGAAEPNQYMAGSAARSAAGIPWLDGFFPGI